MATSGVFRARLTSYRKARSGPFEGRRIYGWTEVLTATADGTDASPTSGKSGTVTSDTVFTNPAVEVNNAALNVGSIVWLRPRGYTNGVMLYEFTAPAGIGANDGGGGAGCSSTEWLTALRPVDCVEVTFTYQPPPAVTLSVEDCDECEDGASAEYSLTITGAAGDYGDLNGEWTFAHDEDCTWTATLDEIDAELTIAEGEVTVSFDGGLLVYTATLVCGDDMTLAIDTHTGTGTYPSAPTLTPVPVTPAPLTQTLRLIYDETTETWTSDPAKLTICEVEYTVTLDQETEELTLTGPLPDGGSAPVTFTRRASCGSCEFAVWGFSRFKLCPCADPEPEFCDNVLRVRVERVPCYEDAYYIPVCCPSDDDPAESKVVSSVLKMSFSNPTPGGCSVLVGKEAYIPLESVFEADGIRTITWKAGYFASRTPLLADTGANPITYVLVQLTCGQYVQPILTFLIYTGITGNPPCASYMLGQDTVHSVPAPYCAFDLPCDTKLPQPFTFTGTIADFTPNEDYNCPICPTAIGVTQSVDVTFASVPAGPVVPIGGSGFVPPGYEGPGWYLTSDGNKYLDDNSPELCNPTFRIICGVYETEELLEEAIADGDCIPDDCTPIADWDGPGAYCVEFATGSGGTICTAVILAEEDRCNPAVTICSGPYETLELAEAECGFIEPPHARYFCDNGTCFEASDGSFATLEECLAQCSGPGNSCCDPGSSSVNGAATGAIGADCAAGYTTSGPLTLIPSSQTWEGTLPSAGGGPTILMRISCDNAAWTLTATLASGGTVNGTMSYNPGTNSLILAGTVSGGPCSGQAINFSAIHPCPP